MLSHNPKQSKNNVLKLTTVEQSFKTKQKWCETINQVFFSYFMSCLTIRWLEIVGKFQRIAWENNICFEIALEWNKCKYLFSLVHL